MLCSHTLLRCEFAHTSLKLKLSHFPFKSKLDNDTISMVALDGPFRVVLGWAYRGLTGGFLLLQNFCVAISVSPHVCFILVLILISIFFKIMHL